MKRVNSESSAKVICCFHEKRMVCIVGKISLHNLKKTIYYFKRNGFGDTWNALRERMDKQVYRDYEFVSVSGEELKRQREDACRYQTTFTILVPVYRAKEAYLWELLQSITAQTYPNWQLVLSDATEDDSMQRVIEEYIRETGDDRILYVDAKGCKGISENSNKGLSYATGEYIGLLDHDDVLTEDALYEMAVAIEKGKQEGIEIEMLYSDEDKCDGGRTKYYEPNIKEKFNRDLILSNNYICHFLVLKAGLLKETGFRKEYDGAQDYDLVLRMAEKLWESEEKILHIPKVLYHWRCHEDSTAANPESKRYAYEAGLRALQDFANRMQWNAEAVHLKHLGFYRLQYRDMFSDRSDVGAVGGNVFGKNKKVIGGRMSHQGEASYAGLSKGFSGYLHRADLTQEAEVLDIRSFRVREELRALFKEVTGVEYRTTGEEEIFDASVLPGDTDYVALSIKLSRAIRERGCRLVYLPEMSTNWK